MTEQNQMEQTEQSDMPRAPEFTGDCALAFVSFMLGLPPLIIGGIVFVIPGIWQMIVLALGWIMAVGGILAGFGGLREISAADGKLRGRWMALSGMGMAALAVIGLTIATVTLFVLAG